MFRGSGTRASSAPLGGRMFLGVTAVFLCPLPLLGSSPHPKQFLPIVRPCTAHMLPFLWITLLLLDSPP